MNKYELVYIVDAHLAAEAKDEIGKQIADSITKAEGKVINSNVWFERQRMSFPIKKVQDASYYLVNWEGRGSTSVKLRQSLKLNERVLRFLIIAANSPKAKV